MATSNPYQSPTAQVADKVAGDGERMSLKDIWMRFDGRIPRKVYWIYGFLPILVVQIIIQIIAGGSKGPGVIAGIIALLLVIPMIWIGLAVSIKRWHDRDKSGWWVLINLVPVIGGLWSLIENGFLRGTVGGNRFGGDSTDLY
jgi:uncharacterized membrane protein YhaH (DUF805 family)